MLGNTSTQPSKFRAKNCVEIIDDAVERVTQVVKLNVNLKC